MLKTVEQQNALLRQSWKRVSEQPPPTLVSVGLPHLALDSYREVRARRCSMRLYAYAGNAEDASCRDARPTVQLDTHSISWLSKVCAGAWQRCRFVSFR